MTDKVMPDPFYVGQPLATSISHIITKMGMEYPREIREGERQLGPFFLPPFQRPPVWSQDQQIKFIESLWLELPVGVYIYNYTLDTPEVDQWLVDGQQRITSVLAYLNDEFPVFGYRYSELPDAERRGFEWKSFPCVELRVRDRAQLNDIYERLTYGGTPHEKVEN